MIRPGNFFPLLPATARYLRIDRSVQKKSTARSGLNDRTIRPQRPHNSAPTTAQFSPNDRTIQPQRPHDSAPTSADLRIGRQKAFSPPLHLLLPKKKKRLRAFLKTFRALRENISANETKHFGVFRRPGNGFPLRRQRTDCRPPANSSFPDHAGSFQEKRNGQNCHFVHQCDIFSVVIR